MRRRTGRRCRSDRAYGSRVRAASRPGRGRRRLRAVRWRKRRFHRSYENCTAVRAAGAAPIHAGDPGYGRHLDRDGDGVGCE
ncbi:excalibur calcium-binding domain-containing protein [Streptomyces lunaelactis]|uniref:excalibur calcium-binding domain-containing protein n=1 Tax=Streptomyces lunaelactis TaxID=1535768 RepID=UPI00359F957C